MINDNPKLRAPRTIAQLHKEMMETDPGCALPLCALRRLVRTNQITSCKVGNKYLVTHGAVEDYICGKSVSDPLAADTVPGIRKED